MPSEDQPYKLPPPSVVADMCLSSAWRDEVDDESRLMLEMSSNTIHAMKKRENVLKYQLKAQHELICELQERCVRLARSLEQAECGK